jgi:Cu-Zn family superoxide dismutase
MMREAVAVFDTPEVKGEVVFQQKKQGCLVSSVFTCLPSGAHGYHIHKAGDLRGKGCLMACSHWHKGKATRHGGPPGYKGPRHTGDLGNIQMPQGKQELKVEYFLRGVTILDILGRSVIVHDEPDDLGEGPFEDSITTGHSGKRIACAVIGRTEECPMNPSSTKKRS